MSETGWAGWLADHHEQENPAERSVRLARLADQRDDREAERAEAERRAALAERHELQQLAAMQAGVTARSAGDVLDGAGRLADEDGEYEAARSVMARIDKRRAARQRDAVTQAERMNAVTGLASRSATVTGGDDMLAGAKETLAGHRAYITATRAKMRAAAGTPRRESRPKGSGGEVVRSHLECVFCQQENVDPETSALLHLDPRLDVPITTAEQAAQAERRTPMIYAGAEVSR